MLAEKWGGSFICSLAETTVTVELELQNWARQRRYGRHRPGTSPKGGKYLEPEPTTFAERATVYVR